MAHDENVRPGEPVPPPRRDRSDEDEPPRRRRRRDRDDDDDIQDDGLVSSIIPYNNSSALIGYYVSIFSLLPILGFILGPAAIILGVKGMSYANKNPAAKGKAHAIVALVLGVFGSLISLGCGGVMLFGYLSSKR